MTFLCSPDRSGAPGTLEKTLRGAKQEVLSRHWHLRHVHGRVLLSFISSKQSASHGFSGGTLAATGAGSECHPAVTSPGGRGSGAEPGGVTAPGPRTRLMHHCPGCHRSHGDKWGRGSGSAPESLPLSGLQEETGPRQVSRRQITPRVTAELLLAGMCPIP